MSSQQKEKAENSTFFLSLCYCVCLTYTFWNNPGIFPLFHDSPATVQRWEAMTGRGLIQLWNPEGGKCVYLYMMYILWVCCSTYYWRFFKVSTSFQKYNHNWIASEQKRLISFYILGRVYILGLLVGKKKILEIFENWRLRV